MASLALPAFAQTANVEVRARASSTPVKTRVEMKAELDTKFEERREQIKTNIIQRTADRQKLLQEHKASSTERMNERRVEIKTEIEARKASSTARRVEIQQNIAKRKAEHTAKVLTATVERLETLITRIESRIAKIKANGGAVLEAEGFIAEAKTHLTEARASIAVFASIDLSGDKAKENFEKIRQTASDVKTHIKAAKEALRDALKELKGSGSANATSTVEVNN